MTCRKIGTVLFARMQTRHPTLALATVQPTVSAGQTGQDRTGPDRTGQDSQLEAHEQIRLGENFKK